MDSRAFYDKYVDRQLRVGVNERHEGILASLRRFGMKCGQHVLEIGSGVGTLTGLIAEELGPEGSLVGVDLSPKSIEVAGEKLASFANTSMLVGDILEMDFQESFDVIVLPDVIEHIPLESHSDLFRKVSGWLDPGGFVLLHYPNPHYLAWCREHRPELLQLIDQPIHADVLTANIYPHGLYLDYLETYSVWIEEGDYVVAVLRRYSEKAVFTDIEEASGMLSRVRGVIRRMIR